MHTPSEGSIVQEQGVIIVLQSWKKARAVVPTAQLKDHGPRIARNRAGDCEQSMASG